MKLFAQFVGLCGVALLIASYQYKNSRKMFTAQLCSSLLYILHFLLLGAFTGCVSMAINVARNFVLISDKEWARKKIWKWIFLLAGIVVAIATWGDLFSIFPAIATAAFTISGFARNGKKIRIINLAIGSPAWITYDVHIHSWSGLAGELFCLCSVIVSILRYGMKALDINE